MKRNEERNKPGRMLSLLLLSTLLIACTSNKNLAQTTAMNANDTLIKHINSSTGDTEVINPHLKQLQQENEMVIALGTLNFAWARKGTYYVLANHNNGWKAYSYESKLPPSNEDAATNIAPQNISTETAEKIKQLYASSELWKTNGDNGENFCSDKKGCNINDGETWTLSITTPQHIHTTTYYAPEFFEECCPGNQYRKQFVNIAKQMMKLLPRAASSLDK